MKLDERGRKLLADRLRRNLLIGVPQEGTYARIVRSLSDEQLVAQHHDHHVRKVKAAARVVSNDAL